jgi:hypothetical protein
MRAEGIFQSLCPKTCVPAFDHGLNPGETLILKGRTPMKAITLALLTLCFGTAPLGWGQQAEKNTVEVKSYGSTPSSGRLLFPKGFLRGYTEVGLFPAHNELDLNRCASYSGAYGGADASCSAFGRYFVSGYFEVQLFARKVGPFPLHRISLFAEPRGYFGRNVPQYRYSAALDAIACERTIGVIVGLTRTLDVRIWQHAVDWVGRYRHALGPADLGMNGPYGLHAGVSARWYFGSWGRLR